MIALFLIILMGLGVAYFSTQNTGLAHITLGSLMASGIPLYVIVIGSILLGIFMSFLISLADSLSNSFRYHGKQTELHHAQKKINELEQKNHDLELENVRLKSEKHGDLTSSQPQSHEEPHPRPDLRPSLFNFRHYFG